MTIEYILYEGGYIVCGLAVIGGAVTLCLQRKSFTRRESVLIALAVFLIPLWIMSLATTVTPLRWYTMLGMTGAYLAARACPPEMLRRGLRYGGIIVAGIILFEAVLTRQRPTFLANPNIAASWLLLLWVWMPAPLAAVAVVATQSRAAIAGFAIAWLARVMPSQWRPRTRLALLGSVALIAPWGAFLRWDTVRERILIWEAGVRLFAERPLAGWGTGSSVLLGYDGFNCAPLTISVEMGLIGLVALAWLVIGLGRQAWVSPSPARWALLALAVQQIADDTWLWPVTALLLGINLALLEVASYDDNRLDLHRLFGIVSPVIDYFRHRRTAPEKTRNMVGAIGADGAAAAAAGSDSLLGDVPQERSPIALGETSERGGLE